MFLSVGMVFLNGYLVIDSFVFNSGFVLLNDF